MQSSTGNERGTRKYEFPMEVETSTTFCTLVSQALTFEPGGREGGTQYSFIRGGPAWRFKPLPFHIPKWYPFYILRAKLHPLSHTSWISQNNRISYNCHVFRGLSVILVQLLKGCKLFVCFALSFLPKFGTLSYTSL